MNALTRFRLLSTCVLSLLVVILTSGCSSINELRLSDVEVDKVKIKTFHTDTNTYKDVEISIYKPKMINSAKPALILLSGCDGGHWEVHKALAKDMHEKGGVTVIVDSIKTYGNQCLTLPTLSGRDRAGHAFATRDFLIDRNLASPSNVAVLGLSHGGWTAVHISKMDMPRVVFDKLENKNPFAAAIALYPWCDLIGTPGRNVSTPFLIIGSKGDDWTPVRRCELLMSNDPNVVIHSYDKPTHAWDAPLPTRTLQTVFGPKVVSYDHQATQDSISRAKNHLLSHLKFD
jgi:dienelactone hydrolase